MSHEAFLAEFTQKFNSFHIITQEIRAMVVADMKKLYPGGQDFSPKA